MCGQNAQMNALHQMNDGFEIWMHSYNNNNDDDDVGGSGSGRLYQYL